MAQRRLFVIATAPLVDRALVGLPNVDDLVSVSNGNPAHRAKPPYPVREYFEGEHKYCLDAKRFACLTYDGD